MHAHFICTLQVDTHPLKAANCMSRNCSFWAKAKANLRSSEMSKEVRRTLSLAVGIGAREKRSEAGESAADGLVWLLRPPNQTWFTSEESVVLMPRDLVEMRLKGEKLPVHVEY